MHKYVQMTVLLSTIFLKKMIIFVFPCSLDRKTDEVDPPWCLSSHCDLLGVLSSNVLIFKST